MGRESDQSGRSVKGNERRRRARVAGHPATDVLPCDGRRWERGARARRRQSSAAATPPSALTLPALRSVGGARAVAIADPDPERLRWWAAGSRLRAGTTTRPRLLRDARSTPSGCACLRRRTRRSPRRCSTRASISRREACASIRPRDRLVERARRASVTRWSDSTCASTPGARGPGGHRGGLIGGVELVRTIWSSGGGERAGLPSGGRRRALGGGVLNEMAVHHVDLWRFLLRSEGEEVFASSRSEEGRREGDVTRS